jgi:hypothetical protein
LTGRYRREYGSEAIWSPTWLPHLNTWPCSANEDLLFFTPFTVGELASVLKRKPFKIIADLMQLGFFATLNQCLGLDTIFKLLGNTGMSLRNWHKAD